MNHPDFEFRPFGPAIQESGDGAASAPPSMHVSRRGFIKVSAAATGGMLLSFALPQAAQAAVPSGDAAGVLAPSVFVRIGPDGLVTVILPQSEMGQNIRTGLSIILADELGADFEQIRVEHAPNNDRRYGNLMTGGSGGTRARWMEFRKAGATARAMLIQAAAQEWGMPAEGLYAEDHHVVSRADGRKIGFGDLAEKAARLPVPEDLPLKDPKEFKLIGKRRPGIDAADITTGKAVYGLDVKVPGMLYASVERSPVFGGRLARLDASAAKATPGVRTVVEIPAHPATHVPAGVAVVAESYWAALSARKKLVIEWDEGPNAADSTDGLIARMKELIARPAEEVLNEGDAEAVLASAPKVISATYETPFLSHATMEPMNRTAHVEGDRVTVWAPSQNPGTDSDGAATNAAAAVLGIPAENVTVHTTMMGGGFGRRLWSDFVAEAAYVSREAGAPVKVVWTREDDMQHDFYRPLSVQRFDAALDEKGLPLAWRYRQASTPIKETTDGSGADKMHESEMWGLYRLPYRVPNRRLEYGFVSAAIPRGWWRYVVHSSSTFAVEGFMNELAAAAGIDPLEYRLMLFNRALKPDPARPFSYDPERLIGVLKLAAEKVGWGVPLPEGRGLGIACEFSFNTYAAEAVEASVDAAGRPRIHRVVAAVDCGTVVNPSGAEAQVMGSIVDAASAALNVQITLRNGRVEQSNFHDYPSCG